MIFGSYHMNNPGADVFNMRIAPEFQLIEPID